MGSFSGKMIDICYLLLGGGGGGYNPAEKIMVSEAWIIYFLAVFTPIWIILSIPIKKSRKKGAFRVQ
jgi:hypothetical protein